MKLKKILSRQEGQSLIEILIAVGIAGLVIGAATYGLSFVLSSSTANQQRQIATSLAEGLMNKVRAVADANWLDIYNLSPKGATSTYYTVASTTRLLIVEGKEGALGEDVTNGFVGYWEFDEATGTTVYDSSGNANHGTSTGPTRTTSCKVSNCLNFDGVDDYATSSDSSTTDPTSAWTLSAWIRRSTTTVQHSILEKYDWASGKGNYAMRVGSNDKFIAYILDGTSLQNCGTTLTTISENTWYQVAATFGSTTDTLICYVNGIAEATNNSATLNPPDSTVDLKIGCRGNDCGTKFNGLIDDVRLYNRALSADEIKRLYNSTIYTKYFAVENVSRDASDNIVTSGGNNDPSSQKITATVEWSAGGGTPKFQIFDYITRWRNRVFDQSDWSGGSGQEGPITEPNEKFASSTNIDFSSTPGSIKVNF